MRIELEKMEEKVKEDVPAVQERPINEKKLTAEAEAEKSERPKQNVKIFDQEHAFNRGLNKLGTYFMANFWFIVGCLPVLTAGVSLAALNSVMFELHRSDDVRVTSVFFRAYRDNLIAGILGEIFSAAFLSMAAVGFIWSLSAPSIVLMIVGFSVFGALAFGTLCFMSFYFGIIAKFENDLPTLAKNGLIVGVTYVRWSVLIVLLWVIGIGIFFVIPELFMYLGFVLAMMGFSILAYITTGIQNRVFGLVKGRELVDEY